MKREPSCEYAAGPSRSQTYAAGDRGRVVATGQTGTVTAVADTHAGYLVTVELDGKPPLRTRMYPRGEICIAESLFD